MKGREPTHVKAATEISKDYRSSRRRVAWISGLFAGSRITI
jgi:hypothetical protein